MAAERVKRRLAAVLVLDVAGYSRLMGGDEVGTHMRVTAALRDIVEPLVLECDGRTIKKTGDGVLVEFASVVEATRCAAAIQRTMGKRETDEPDERRIAFRIGINLGDVIIESDEIYGDGVNIAVRVEALAEPGGICVTRTVADQVGDKLDVEFTDIGEHELKNIARPVRVFRVGLAAAGKTTALPLSRIIPGFRDRPAIAVLPFANMSGDPDQDYFADGLTEDLITALASWRSFPVIARNSVFAYKGRNVDLRTVSRELGVLYVLEGSVRRQGTRVRIHAQMIEADTNHHIFADRYDREVTDVFAVQDEIETSIVGALEPELLRVERDRIASAPQLFSAYDHLQRGLWHHYRYSAQNNAKAQAFFRSSLAIEPNYAPPAAALAITRVHAIVSGWMEDIEANFAETLSLGQQAVSLDPRDPQAHFALALGYFHTRQIRAAIREMEEVTRLNPSHAAAFAILGNLNNYIDRSKEALRHVKTALRLSPMDPRQFIWMPALAGAYYLIGRYEEAIEAGRRGLSLRPDYLVPIRYVIAGLGQLGRTSEARDLLPDLRRLDPTTEHTRRYLERYYIERTALNRIIDGLTKAGFEAG